MVYTVDCLKWAVGVSDGFLSGWVQALWVMQNCGGISLVVKGEKERERGREMISCGCCKQTIVATSLFLLTGGQNLAKTQIGI